jgi:hypothetical protein
MNREVCFVCQQCAVVDVLQDGVGDGEGCLVLGQIGQVGDVRMNFFTLDG